MQLQIQRSILKWLSVSSVLALSVLLAACSQSFSLGGSIQSNGIWKVSGGYRISPPASVLASFDASQVVADYTLNNTSIYARAGDLSVTVSDQNTGAVLGSASFQYTINSANQLVLTDPASATQWIRSFSTYNGYVTVAVNVPVLVTAPRSGLEATVASSDVYHGITVGSASTYISHCVTPTEPQCRVY